MYATNEMRMQNITAKKQSRVKFTPTKRIYDGMWRKIYNFVIVTIRTKTPCGIKYLNRHNRIGEISVFTYVENAFYTIFVQYNTQHIYSAKMINFSTFDGFAFYSIHSCHEMHSRRPCSSIICVC